MKKNRCNGKKETQQAENSREEFENRKCEQKQRNKVSEIEMSINSGDVGVNSAGKSRMVSRARQGFVEDESRSKTKSKEVGDGMEG